MYVKFNIATESRKLLANRPMKVHAHTLSLILALFYLENEAKPATSLIGPPDPTRRAVRLP